MASNVENISIWWRHHVLFSGLSGLTKPGRPWNITFIFERCPIMVTLVWRQWHNFPITWWRHQMETFSALLAICAGYSPVPGEFPAQMPVTQSFDVFFDVRLNKRWVNNHEAGNLRRHHAHYDVTVMSQPYLTRERENNHLSQFRSTMSWYACAPQLAQEIRHSRFINSPS